MKHPFKVIRGDQAEPVATPTKFIKFDNTRAEIERIRARFYALRDKAILKERAKLNKL